MLRATHLSLVLLAPLLLAAGAVASPIGGVSAGEDGIEASSQELACEAGGNCEDGVDVIARASVEAPSVDADRPAKDCYKNSTLRETVADCQFRDVSLDEGQINTYAGIQGLNEAEDKHADTQGQQAAPTETGADGWTSSELQGAVLLGALGATASGAAAWVGVRRLVPFLLAPLASRLKRSELLDNDTRRKIYDTVETDPGVNLRGLAEKLDLAWGTLLHHLKKLEDGHLLVSERYGKYRRFFLNGSTYSKEEQARLAALSTPSTARVAEYILENPGTNQAEIGDAIGVTPSTVLFHVRRLKDVDLVREERKGRYVHYYPELQDHEAQQLATA